MAGLSVIRRFCTAAIVCAGLTFGAASQAADDGSTAFPPTAPVAPAAPLALTKTFSKPGFGYSIRYPGDWRANFPGEYAVVFGGIEGTAAHYTTVAIQNILSPRPGEPERAAAALLGEIGRKIAAETNEPSVLTQQPFLYKKGDVKLGGYQMVADFLRKADAMRQWIVALPRPSGTVVHLWIYTAPADEFYDLLPTAQAMLESWIVDPKDQPAR